MPKSLQPDSTAESTDPRIVRSRHMLMEALAKLLIHKSFDDISIQEIADEATLNRATFYLHYPDKNALLQAMAAARFGELIARRRSILYRLRRCASSHCAWRLRLSRRDHRLSRPVGEDAPRRFHHPCRGRHVPEGCR